jgi:hypothetical protein
MVPFSLCIHFDSVWFSVESRDSGATFEMGILNRSSTRTSAVHTVIRGIIIASTCPDLSPSPLIPSIESIHHTHQFAAARPTPFQNSQQ